MKAEMMMLLLMMAQTSSSSSSPSCSFDAMSDALNCKLRTLDGSGGGGNNVTDNNGNGPYSPSMQKSRSVTVTCSDVFFYESVLRTNHFGYLPQLKRLTLDSCKIRRVPGLAFSGLSGLKSLDLRSRNSEWSAMAMELEKDALTGLNELRRLNLTQNNIWTLPESTFCALDNLRALNLSQNFIQDVLDLGFSQSQVRSCRLPLKSLDLSRNSIAVLPRAGFGQLARLDTLLLEANNINELEDDALEGLGALSTLNLANNQLVALPPEVFQYTRRLLHLELQNNSLTALAPGLFSGLDHLLVLNLSRNDLSSNWVNANTFRALNSLVALDLSHNRLSKLDGQALSTMSSLQILNLDHNGLHTLSPNAFRNLPALKILRLSHNAIETLNPRTLQSLAQLTSLSLDHNSLRSLHRNALKNCTRLQDLALHGNLLEDVPDAIRELPLLRTLHLGSNRIVAVKNSSFEGLGHLYGLSLAGNGIDSIESLAFAPVSDLQALNLAHNSISKLDQTVFNALKKLRTLRLDGNLLEDINGLLTAQSELHWLNVSSNRLAWFDYAFVPRSVRWLDLHDNRIEELGNYYKLSSGFDLLTLDASQNRIESLSPLALPGR
jgi:Leucine-rich repeat (LRR) protein